MLVLEGKADCSAKRLDNFIADVYKNISRSQLKNRLKEAFVNSKSVKLSKEIKDGDSYKIVLEDEICHEEKAEDIPLKIIFEDDNVIVVNKQQGMVVHPAHGNWNGTLLNAILGKLSQENKPERSGIVHRLDKDTSGVIITAKNNFTQEYLEKQFRERKTKKTYFAIVKGRPEKSTGIIDNYLARDKKNRKRFAIYTGEDSSQHAKHAVTKWKCLSSVQYRGNGNFYSLLQLEPKTGRTHQLRVHCKEINLPIVGDPLYSRKDSNFPNATLMLHAAQLKIALPIDNEKIFSAQLPERFIEMATILKIDISALQKEYL